VSGLEPLTCRLQDVCSQAAHALAAPMAPAIALTAPAALGLFCASSHESFQAGGGQKSMAITERSGQKPPQRRRESPWSDITVDQVVARPNRAVLGIKAAPLHSAAGPASAPGSGPGAPLGARRATLARMP